MSAIRHAEPPGEETSSLAPAPSTTQQRGIQPDARQLGRADRGPWREDLARGAPGRGPRVMLLDGPLWSLARAGTVADKLEVKAVVTFDKTDEGWRPSPRIDRPGHGPGGDGRELRRGGGCVRPGLPDIAGSQGQRRNHGRGDARLRWRTCPPSHPVAPG